MKVGHAAVNEAPDGVQIVQRHGGGQRVQLAVHDEEADAEKAGQDAGSIVGPDHHDGAGGILQHVRGAGELRERHEIVVLKRIVNQDLRPRHFRSGGLLRAGTKTSP